MSLILLVLLLLVLFGGIGGYGAGWWRYPTPAGASPAPYNALGIVVMVIFLVLLVALLTSYSRIW
jgi:hypothetical protein